MENIASRIEHTLLKIDASTGTADLKEGAELVAEKKLRAFVVPPQLVRTTAKRFPEMMVVTVAGYPLGFETLPEKVFACQQAAQDGAAEVDVVLDLFALVTGNLHKIRRELEVLSDAAKHAQVSLKVIIETPILTRQRVVEVCKLINDFDVLAAKTSTGYAREPTTAQDVALMRSTLRDGILLKASGGIRKLSDVRKFIDSGADLIGTSKSQQIVAELEREAAG